MRRALVLLAVLLFAGAAFAQPAQLAPCLVSGTDCAAASGAVTGSLTSGRVALSTGATTVGDDSGFLWTGTGLTFFGTFGGGIYAPIVSSGAAATGTNTAGANLTIQPQAGTGSATGSSIVFQTPSATGSGTTGQTQTTRLTISEGSIIPAVPIVSGNYIYASNFRSYTGDNLDDIGQSGTKFKTGYFGTSVVAPVVQLTLATPTTSGDTCVAGTFWADANYLYVCTATNTIKRAALSAF